MILKLIFVLCIILEFIFVPLFLKAQWPGMCRKSLFYKMICATSFLTVGVISAQIAENKSTYAIIMLIGLCFGWLGDFFLHFRPTQRCFAIGFVSFLVGHVFYLAAYIRTLPIIYKNYNLFNIYEIIAGVSIFVVGLILVKVFKVTFSSKLLKYSCIVYGGLLIGMFVKASSLGLNFWLEGGKYGIIAFLVLSVGSLCFMLSDATLGIIMFGGQKRNKPLKVFNIATYFAAQVLLASSILFINV